MILRGAALPSIGATKRSKFVDQASSRPTSLAEKTTVLPSGLTAYSSLPPKGREGVSASMAFIRSTEAPVREPVRRRGGCACRPPTRPSAARRAARRGPRSPCWPCAAPALRPSLRASCPGRRAARTSERPAVGRDLERVDVERQARDLLGLAAVERQAEHLLRSRTRAEEEEALAVRRPAGLAVVRLVLRQPPRRRAVERRQPHVGPAAVRLEVGVAHREGDPRSRRARRAGRRSVCIASMSCTEKGCVGSAAAVTARTRAGRTVVIMAAPLGRPW